MCCASNADEKAIINVYIFRKYYEIDRQYVYAIYTKHYTRLSVALNVITIPLMGSTRDVLFQ
jgi:hypothetical protein